MIGILDKTADSEWYGMLDALVEIGSILSVRFIFGDIRLWVGDPSTSSGLVSLSRGTQGRKSVQSTNPESII